MLKPLVFVLCALSIASDGLAQEPQWLKDARAREGQNLPEQAVRADDGLFTGTVTGKVLTDKIASDEGVYQILIDIGSQAPATCEVIEDGVDLAGMLHAAADLTMKELVQLQGKVELRVLERIDAGAFGSAVFMSADWVYRVNDGKAPRLGALKQIVVSKDGYGLYCAHVDVGYSKSFRTAVKSLAESLRFRDVESVPYFTEVTVATLLGEKVGVTMLTMERDDEGDTLMTVSSAIAFRTGPDSMRATDTVHVQWIRPNGALISAGHIVTSNGEVDVDLSLRQTSAGKWTVAGDFKGKALDKVIESQAGPDSWIQEARARRSLFGADARGKELGSRQWSTADPTRFIESRVTVLSALDADRLAVRETVESVKADVVLDRVTGLATKMVVPIGPAQVEMERVHVQGSF